MEIKALSLKSFTIIMLFMVVIIQTKAQEIIMYNNNIPRCDDVIEKQQVKYISAGDAGEGVIWDLSHVRNLGLQQNEFYYESDSLLLYESTPKSINKYLITNDEMNHVGYETREQSMIYDMPVIQMAYPFSYGQSVVRDYSGIGYYCSTKALKSVGNVHLEADGYGTVYLSESDTLHNVIRVHSIRSGSIGMGNIEDTASITRKNMKQEIEERYQWYALGYRYPVFETISISYYDNMELVSCKQTAYRYLPEMQRQLDDEDNERILQEENEKLNDNDNDNNDNDENIDILHYDVSVNGNTINLKYDLDKDANITILVCNYMGCTFKHMSFKATSGKGLETDIDCSGLSPDIYVLYINVNGKIYNEKINLKH